MIEVRVLRRKGRRFYQAEWRDPTTGRVRSKSTGETTASRAERFAARLERDLNAGHGTGDCTWRAFRRAFEAEVLPTHPPATQRKFVAALRHVQRIIDPANLSALDGRQVSRLKAALLAGGDGRRPLAPASVRGNLAYLRVALEWAVDCGLLGRLPRWPTVKVVPGPRGRAITAEEFDRLLEQPAKLDPDNAAAWCFLLRGLWSSGLRLGEALDLHWTDDSRLAVLLDRTPPMLVVRATAEKGRKERLLPIAPEFAELLEEVPTRRRRGHVFRLPCDRRVDGVSKRLVEFGRASGVRVGPQKFVSAHDLRRSFGTRWSEVLLPQDLQVLMRHESIETTLRFYVRRDADRTARKLWDLRAGTAGTDTSADTSHV